MSLIRRFARARQGNIALMSALLLPPILLLAGVAVDFSFVVRAQGRLEQAARSASTNAVITARRVVNNGPAGTSTDSQALADAQSVGMSSFKAQTSGLPNLALDLANTNIAVTRNGNTLVARLNFRANQSTFFAKIVGYATIPLTGSGSMVVGVADVPIDNAVPPSTGAVLKEAWSPIRNPRSVNGPINDWSSGTPGTQLPMIDPAQYPAVFDNPAVSAALRIGSSDGLTPPILSKVVYAQAGAYELRYWYKSTIVYPQYEPVYICGTVEDEMNWVAATQGRDPNPVGWRQGDALPPTRYVSRQTSRAGVYLDPILTNPQLATPPAAASLPRPPVMSNPNQGIVRGDTSINNRIDICAYSSRWIERKVTVQITNDGYYWLSFVAEPPQGELMNGFYLGPLQFCRDRCDGAVSNNFPWSAGTVLYQDSFEGVPLVSTGTPFDKTARGFTSDAKYESLPAWEMGAYGAGAMDPSSFAYDTSGRIDGPTSVMTQKLNIWLYRRMLLMPGVYLVDFKAAMGKSLPAMRWCPTVNLDSSGTATTTWNLTDTTNPVNAAMCICPAGAMKTIINSDEKVHNQANFLLNGGLGAASGVSSGAPSDYINTIDPTGSAMGDCHATTVPVADRYCFLAPRTQYYGFQFRINGLYLTSTANTQFAGFDTQLGAGAAYLDSLKVTLLSAGVKNKLNTDASGAGDFDDYYNKCFSRLVTAAPTATSVNVISGGVPMWPGRSVKNLNRVKVTAPLPN